MKNDFFALISSFFKKLHSLSKESEGIDYGKEKQTDEIDIESGG